MSRQLYYVVVVPNRHSIGDPARFNYGRAIAGPFDRLEQAFDKYTAVLRDPTSCNINLENRAVELWVRKEGKKKNSRNQ